MSAPRPELNQLVTEELRHHISAIRDSFVDRPVPAGDVRCDSPEKLRTFLLEVLDSVSFAVSEAAAAINALFSETAAERDGALAAAHLRSAVEDLIGTFHEVWRRPWAPPHADGQPLLSAVAERPLRDLLRAFEQASEVIRTRAEQGLEGSPPDHLTVVFEAEAEMEAVEQWASGLLGRLTAQSLRRKATPSWGTVALAFLLGHWWGKE